MQDAVVERLFAGYFSEGRDVGDRAVLAEIAERAGLPRGDTLAFLNGEEGIGPVRATEAEAHMAGFIGVPAFVVNGQLLFSGALRSEIMIERILAAAQPSTSKKASSTRVVG